MAELAVATALGVIQITMPLLQTLSLPADVRRDVTDMESWLTSINAYVEGCNDRQGSETHLDRLHKARKIAYDIEDVLDAFILHSPPYTFHHHSATRWVHKAAHHFRHGFPLRAVKDKIESIRNDIKLLKSQAAAFGGHRADSPSTIRLRPVSPLLSDEQMVGYENPKRELMDRLVDRENRLVRIAVDGPAGSGKTTLVKNVFWERRIQAQFDCHAWVTLSQKSDVENIARNMLLQLCKSRKDPYPGDDGFPVLERLQRYLVGKRYIVVLDDVWRREDLIHFRDALPDSRIGSRIIITTNNAELSSLFASSSHDHRCSLIALESFIDVWKLFCRKAFSNGECPLEMKGTATKIVKRCEGLPLAIVAVAGALAQKPPDEWEDFHRNFGRETGTSTSRVNFFLSLITDAFLRSYTDLSRSLKCCFLYMSIFPEDYSVKRGRLIRLWVAEGFAVADGQYNMTAEEVAEEYLNQLIHRNLVHVTKWDVDGRPRNCRLLNNVLKFIINKTNHENFASVFPAAVRMQTTSSNQNQNQRQMIRRLAVHDDDFINTNNTQVECWPGNDDLASVRSLLLLRLSGISPTDFGKNISKLKLIKVIDVQSRPTLTEFPKEIARFTLVRYLSFRDTQIKLIPTSIEKLSYLETLDLKRTHVTELPHQISNLHNLCHLFVVYKSNNTDSAQGVELREGINKLANLQSLSLIRVGRKGGILKDLKALIRLRKLALTGLIQAHGRDLCAAVQLMKSLTTLELCSATKEECLQLEEMENPPQSLQRLFLKGRLIKLPRWISKLNGLVRIILQWSGLSDSPLKSLERLPKLMELHLVDCYNGVELTFEGPGFKKLKILKIEELGSIKMMVIEDGAMSVVEKISLRKCGGLTMVLGLEKLKEAVELTLDDMAEELVARFRSGGEDGECVEHIHLIQSFTLHGQSPENLSAPVSN